MSRRLPILTYHTIDDTLSPISITPAEFETHLAVLAEQGYRSISLSQIVECLRNQSPFPENAVAITFDDGYASVLHQALPRLRRYGFDATLFIVTSYCETDDQWLTWAQIEQLLTAGFEIGAHSHTHPPLAHISEADAMYEIIESRRILENRLGKTVNLFCYPYGDVNNAIQTIVAGHYFGAVSTRLGYVQPGSNPVNMERLDSYYLSPRRIRGFRTPYSPIYFRTRHYLRWVKRLFRPDWA